MLISGDVRIIHAFNDNDNDLRNQVITLTITELIYVKNYKFYNLLKNNFYISNNSIIYFKKIKVKKNILIL